MNGLLGKCRGVPAVNDKRRLNLSFAMSSPIQREAWELLSTIPSGQRTETVCRAVCRMYGQESILEIVRRTIREELSCMELTPAKNESELPQEAGDVGDDVLGFLSALQNDGGEEF